MNPSLRNICILLLILLGNGCAKHIIAVGYPPEPAPEPQPQSSVVDVPPPPGSAVPAPEPPVQSPGMAPAEDPRMVAARNLTGEGMTLLGRGDATAAIDVLEQSLSLDARNGETYYYLAEAWNRKGNQSQARQFHRLARTYLEGRSGWPLKLDRQAARLGL